MGAVADAKHEWRHFCSDAPGERFQNHRDRMRCRPRWHTFLASGVGTFFIATGFVLLFMPGPGLLSIGFGVALFASHSVRLASLLDRGEVRLRRLSRRTKRRWRHLSGHAKVGLLLGVAATATVAMVAMWRMFLIPLFVG